MRDGLEIVLAREGVPTRAGKPLFSGRVHLAPPSGRGRAAVAAHEHRHRIVVVLDVPSDQPVRFDQAPGTRVPTHSSAMGKCLLAHGDIPAAVAALPSLEKITDRTITDRTRLQTELEAVRARGWALNDEERNPGVRAVAVPVSNGGRAIAAIAVQGPVHRLPDERLGEIARRAQATAARIAPALAAGVR